MSNNYIPVVYASKLGNIIFLSSFGMKICSSVTLFVCLYFYAQFGLCALTSVDMFIGIRYARNLEHVSRKYPRKTNQQT